MNIFLNSHKNTECSKRSGKQNAEFGMSNLETVNQGAADWCMVHGNVWSPGHSTHCHCPGPVFRYNMCAIKTYAWSWSWYDLFINSIKVTQTILHLTLVAHGFLDCQRFYPVVHRILQIACMSAEHRARVGRGGWRVGDHLTVCPGYCADQAYTNPDNTGMQPHNQHARHRRMEWIPRAHISNQNISVFWVTHLQLFSLLLSRYHSSGR